MGKIENEGMPVVRLDRQLKYQGNILKMYEDTVLANGHEAHWDFIHHDGAAAVVPVTDDGKILMVRQYRNALKSFPDILTLFSDVLPYLPWLPVPLLFHFITVQHLHGCFAF